MIFEDIGINTNNKKLTSILSYPTLIWFSFFLIIPLVIVLVLSVITRGTYGGIEWQFEIESYIRTFNWTYFKIFLVTIRLALLTAFICLVLAYPVAWKLATSRERLRPLLLLLIAIPFFTNLIIRIYSIRLFVGVSGPLQGLLTALGVVFDPYLFTQNQVLVFYGMVTTYLPFMVFPLYSAFEKFDFSLVEAAQDLGAGPLRILFSVIIPNMKVALVNGFILVFIPSLGEFLIPDLLGGAKNMLVGNLITEQFLKARDWPFGAALSVVLILILVMVPLLLRRFILRRAGEA